MASHHDDDEFFGDQEDLDDDDYGGLLGEREHLARQNELHNVGYLESYEEHKETRLQEGFQTGYKESFEASLRIGKLLGQTTAPAQLLLQSPPSSTTASSDANTFTSSQNAGKRVYDFLRTLDENKEQTTEGGNPCRDAQTELEDLEKELQQMLEN